MPARLRGNAHVLQRRGVRQDVGDLIRARDPLEGNSVGWKPCNVFAIKQDASRRRGQNPSQAIKESAFASTVRPDDRANFLAIDLEIDVVNCGKSAKSPGQRFGAQHWDLCTRPGFFGRGGRVNGWLHLQSGRSELAGRREECLVAGDGFDDAVFPVLDVENDLQWKRLMVLFTEQFVTSEEIVTHFHLQAFKRLDQLHRVLTAFELGPFHADLQSVHRLEVCLHVPIGQRARWIDLRQPDLGLIEEFLVMRRVKRTLEYRDVSINADEPLDLVAECRKISRLCNGAIAGPFVLLRQSKIVGLVSDGYAVLAEKDPEQPVELAGDL